MGPVIHMSTIRFEGKHQMFKKMVNQSKNFVNVCKSLAIRHQQFLSINNFAFGSELVCGRKLLLDDTRCAEDEYLLNIINDNISVYEISFVVHGTYVYKNHLFVIYSGKIYEIRKILEFLGEIRLYCVQYKLLEFHSFFNSFKIDIVTPIQKTIIQFIGSGIKHPYEKKMLDGEEYIIADTLDVGNLLRNS